MDAGRRAIERYHEILAGGDLAAETQGPLGRQLRDRRLFFGDRPICTVLRPRFLTPGEYRFLQERVQILTGAFGKAYRRAIADERFRAQFGLLDWEEQLIRAEPGFAEPSPVSRLDAFYLPGSGELRFTEFNAETPAGAAYGDVLSEVFLTLPVMREFLATHEVRPLPQRHNVLHALLGTYAEWSGSRSLPRIAIVDWPDVPTYSEFVLSAEYFRAQGIDTVITEPAELEYRGGKLYAGEGRVDLIYKRVLISELVERCGLEHPMVRAVTDGAVCMVNGFRCKILHKKASLAVLSDEENADLFDGRELDAIRAHIPWTRVLSDRVTTFEGREADLVELVRRNRERMVLKPNDEYGGTGIVLGWEVDDSTWDEAVRRGLDLGFIVQDRIAIPTEPYPTFTGGSLRVEDRIMDTAPFVFQGEYMDGCLTRLSTESLVNVTAGGGSSLATFLVEPRPA
jgi:uncharacterized circularly permuted ATP-grasp superfamily protein